MVKRLISADTSDVLAMNGTQLKQSIKASEGRVVLSENVVVHEALDGLTTSEIAAAFGADLILLNALDVLEPVILGLYKGEETLQAAEKLGFNFIVLTGNPGTGVTNAQIATNVKLAKQHFSGLVIAGKMHGAGVDEPVVSKEAVKAFLEAGADVILVPAVGTVPEFDETELKEIVKYVHANGGLVMSTIGTSQEGSGASYIENIAIRNKICGVDIQHIGDAAWGIQSPFENIYALSKAIRGERHAIQRMARSINR